LALRGCRFPAYEPQPIGSRSARINTSFFPRLRIGNQYRKSAFQRRPEDAGPLFERVMGLETSEIEHRATVVERHESFLGPVIF